MAQLKQKNAKLRKNENVKTKNALFHSFEYILITRKCYSSRISVARDCYSIQIWNICADPAALQCDLPTRELRYLPNDVYSQEGFHVTNDTDSKEECMMRIDRTPERSQSQWILGQWQCDGLHCLTHPIFLQTQERWLFARPPVILHVLQPHPHRMVLSMQKSHGGSREDSSCHHVIRFCNWIHY